METLPKRYILETVEACKEYTERLNADIQNAEAFLHSINSSAEVARRQVEDTFQLLANEVIAKLHLRKQFLLSQIKKFESEAEVPLMQCMAEIVKSKEAAEALLQDADGVIKSGGFASENLYQSFIDQNAKLGNLPAVPDKECVPNITFQVPPSNFLQTFLESLSSLGEISKLGPVQLTCIEALPGSLLVRWDEVESDTDVHAYRLQMADEVSIEVTKDEALFKDIYIGTERSYTVRDIKPGVVYAFRVCCCMNEKSDWTAWSYIKKGHSNVNPYTWDHSNCSAIVTDEGKMARITQPCVLYSDGPQIKPGHSFQVSLANYDSSKQTNDEGIALCGQNCHKSLRQPNVIFVTFDGKIFVDGSKNRTQLPNLNNGEKMTWDCQLLKNGKWRITIEVKERCVTYDWTPLPTVAQLYFSAVLHQSDAHILVH